MRMNKVKLPDQFLPTGQYYVNRQMSHTVQKKLDSDKMNVLGSGMYVNKQLMKASKKEVVNIENQKVHNPDLIKSLDDISTQHLLVNQSMENYDDTQRAKPRFLNTAEAQSRIMKL